MPNTPAFINHGIMVGYPNECVSISKCQASEALFASLGKFYGVEDEEQMHGVTAMNGSGAAYLCHTARATVADFLQSDETFNHKKAAR